MTDINNKMEIFKKTTKELLLDKDFHLYEKFCRSFEELSLEQKITAFDFIKSLPQSQRKTLLFSAFIKKEKKKVSREIASLGYFI